VDNYYNQKVRGGVVPPRFGRGGVTARRLGCTRSFIKLEAKKLLDDLGANQQYFALLWLSVAIGGVLVYLVSAAG
jgi:hypothetical protein